MKQPHRRAFLFVPLLFLLVRCGASGPDIAQASADARAVVAGVSQAYTALKTLYPTAIPPATDAQVQAILASAPAILSQISAANDAATNAAGLRGVESIVNQTVNIVASILPRIPGVPPEVTLAFQAAVVLLPILEATANQLVPVTAARAMARPAAFRSGMTVEQARAVLR